MNLLLIMKAITYAADAHKRQKRKFGGDPYVNHLLRVGEKAAQAGLSSEAVAAGVLHDVVEDTSVTKELLAQSFSPRVVTLVMLLTKSWEDDAPEEAIHELKLKYYEEIKKDTEAIELKILDRADNIRDAASCLPLAIRWARNYLRKTELEFPDLVALSKNDIVKKHYQESLRLLQDSLQRFDCAD